MEGQFPKDGGGDHSVNERKIPKTILDPQGKLLQSWNVIFLLSCVISVLLDPLFFYLPVINEDKKCIGLDKKLWITAIVLRSVTDIIYLMHIILQFRTGYLWPYFLIDILAILPIPQVRERLLFNYIIYRQTIMFTSCCNLTSKSGFTQINHYLFLGKTFSICSGIWYGGIYKVNRKQTSFCGKFF